jgi:hypothetical protein
MGLPEIIIHWKHGGGKNVVVPEEPGKMGYVQR